MIDYSTITGGNWRNFDDRGTFNGERVGNDQDAVFRLSGFFNLHSLLSPLSADNTSTVVLNILDDDSVTGVMVTVRGDETTLTGTRAGSSISVSGGNNRFALSFDPGGTDSLNDLTLGTTSGFIGTMNNASGTSFVIGTSCQPD